MLPGMHRGSCRSEELLRESSDRSGSRLLGIQAGGTRVSIARPQYLYLFRRTEEPARKPRPAARKTNPVGCLPMICRMLSSMPRTS